MTIPEISTNFGAGQSLCGFYTIPAGQTAYILASSITVDSNKSVDLFFFRRSSITDTTSSYDGTLRLQNIYTGVTGNFEIIHKSNEAYPELTDIGFMGQVSTGTAANLSYRGGQNVLMISTVGTDIGDIMLETLINNEIYRAAYGAQLIDMVERGYVEVRQDGSLISATALRTYTAP